MNGVVNKRRIEMKLEEEYGDVGNMGMNNTFQNGGGRQQMPNDDMQKPNGMIQKSM